MTNRLYGSVWHGVSLGLLSTLAGLASAELIVGLIRGANSPVVPVGQEVIDIVPPAVKDWAIDWFGTADKAVLILGTLFSLAVVGSLVGNLAVKGNRAMAYAVTVIVGVIGVWAVMLRPDPTFGKALPSIVGTLVSIAVVWWLAPRPAGSAAVGSADPAIAARIDAARFDPAHPDAERLDRRVDRPVDLAGPVARRGFVLGASTVALLSAMAGGLGRVLGRRFDIADERATVALPDPVRSPVGAGPAPNRSVAAGPMPGAVPGPTEFGLDEVTPFVVPNDDFYRIDTALVVPQVPKDSWKLRIFGMVDHELELTFADLLARPQVERHVTLSCVSNQVGGDLVGNALWQGVLLKDVLDEAGVHPAATQVVSRSIDGWNCGSPTSAIMDGRDAMLAVGMNGEPLPAEHGYPVRLVVPGLYGYVSATKWVTQIELMRWEDFDGYWVPRGWAKEGPVKTMARIDRPRSGREYAAAEAGAIDIAGVAWAVHRGIGAVEVSIDGGEWRECELAGVPSDDTWRQWRYRWSDSSPGEHEVAARAYDGDGEPQPIGPEGVAPDGAEGYHKVTFDVR